MPNLNKTNRSVVLLHGWPGSPNDFRRVLPLLANSIHVFALDLLGFGDGFSGSLLLEEATAEAHADRVIEFIHALGLEKPVIAGYDIGSFPSQWADRLNEFFEDARLVSTPKIGHFVPLEAPDVFARAITDLLETP